MKRSRGPVVRSEYLDGAIDGGVCFWQNPARFNAPVVELADT